MRRAPLRARANASAPRVPQTLARKFLSALRRPLAQANAHPDAGCGGGVARGACRNAYRILLAGPVAIYSRWILATRRARSPAGNGPAQLASFHFHLCFFTPCLCQLSHCSRLCPPLGSRQVGCCQPPDPLDPLPPLRGGVLAFRTAALCGCAGCGFAP